MFPIALLPIREEETRTLLASNEVWSRFRDHLKRTKQGSLLSAIVLDTRSPVTKIILPTEQAYALLRAAGLRY